MIVDRRVFVAGAALVAVAPALRLLPADAAIQQPAFMISGWSEEVGSVDNQVWLRVGLGWKSAWR